MTKEDKLKAVNFWQSNPLVHPLTCGRDSNHPPLIGIMHEQTTPALECIRCGYLQAPIPDAVLRWYQIEVLDKVVVP